MTNEIAVYLQAVRFQWLFLNQNFLESLKILACNLQNGWAKKFQGSAEVTLWSLRRTVKILQRLAQIFCRNLNFDY